jgi:hypothetical protein
VSSARHAVEELANVLGWHQPVPGELTWDEVEAVLGTRLPSDFKQLMTKFPSGAFAERFYVYSPVQSKAALDEFRNDWRESLDWLVELRDDESDIPYPIYPEPGGVIPWGLGDEHLFYWETEGPNDDPDSWRVVFCGRLGEYWGEYRGDVSSFLLDAITGRFSNRYLYYEPTAEKYTFTPFDRFL